MGSFLEMRAGTRAPPQAANHRLVMASPVRERVPWYLSKDGLEMQPRRIFGYHDGLRAIASSDSDQDICTHGVKNQVRATFCRASASQSHSAGSEKTRRDRMQRCNFSPVDAIMGIMEPNEVMPNGGAAPGGEDEAVADKAGLRLVLLDGLASEAMGTLTTGVYLAGYALQLGADNFIIGVIAAVPFLVQLLQIPAVALVERWRVRRAITVWTSGIGRGFLLATAAAPLLPGRAALAWLILCLALHQGLAALSGCAWNAWMRDLVPPRQYGRFFGGRTAATTALAVGLGILGSVAIDAWKRHVPGAPAAGYAGVFALGGAAGLYGVYLLSRTPEPAMAPATEHESLFRLLAKPFHDHTFRRLIIFLAAWNFAANLAAPFFTVYLLRSLGYPLALVMALNIASQLSNIAFLSVWGLLIDRFNNKAVLSVCAPLFLFCVLAWSFTGLSWMHGFVLPLLVLLHILMGLSTAGIGLASGNIAMKLSPRGQSTAYLAANSVVSALSAAVAPMITGVCADFFADHALTLSLSWKSPNQAVAFDLFTLHALTFFFAAAAVIGLVSLTFLGKVRETGEAEDRVALQSLLQELRRSMHGLSSVAGLVRLARFPVVIIRSWGIE